MASLRDVSADLLVTMTTECSCESLVSWSREIVGGSCSVQFNRTVSGVHQSFERLHCDQTSAVFRTRFFLGMLIETPQHVRSTHAHPETPS